MKIILSINICFFALGISAERLTLHRPEDARSNLLFSQLPQYCGSAEQLLASTTSAAYALLSYMGPSIKLLPSYTGIFTGNCSIFFDSTVKEVACDINPSTGQTLTTGSVIIQGTPLPEQYQNQITQSHILRTNIFADWRRRKSQEFETDLHFKVSTYSSTESKSSLRTQSESANISKSISPTLKATRSFVSSLSNTLARLSKTPLETLSASYSALSATASSNTPSISSTHTSSSSKSPSGTLSKTQTFTKAQTLSLLLSKTATDVLSASVTRSKSGSLSKTGTVTDSPTAEPSLTRSQTTTPTTTEVSTVICNTLVASGVSVGISSDPQNVPMLVWECALNNNSYSYTGAQNYCSSLGGSWRLPTIWELKVLYNQISVLDGFIASYYWSSTLQEGNPASAWTLLFNNGNIGGFSTTTSSSYVRCVKPCPMPPTTGLLAAWNQTGGTYADATNQTGRYTVSNGVVTDTLTQIQWEQTASSGTMIWSDSATYCAGRNTGGLAGWRVPNIGELNTLVDYRIANPTVPINAPTFPDTPSGHFWSSTPDLGNAGNSWYVSFDIFGSSYWDTVATLDRVRCVRSCYSTPPTMRYTISLGVVTDTVTGLVWQQTVTGSTMTQTNAFTHCTTLNLAGFNSNWRLPTVRELSTLVDYSISNGNLRMNGAFAGAPGNDYWSSTPLAGSSAKAWGVAFISGDVHDFFMTHNSYVRCVR